LERTVARLLEKDRRRRYGDANELLADFELLTMTAAPASLRFPMQKVRRRSLVVAMGGLIVIATIGSVLWRNARGRVPVPATAAAMPAVTAAHDPASDRTKTIAVLPFTNMSPDPDEDYLVDGLTEELIGALSKVSALRVVARTSAFAFKGANRDIREIGRALDVGTILEGSVQKVDDRIRVRAQLINVADGLHLWSETYDREVSDMFAIQRDLALRIAVALEAGLSPAERQRLVRRPTTSPDAFALYLKGRHFWNQRTSGAFLRAIEYFEQAIEIDPGYAQAHAGLAAVYSLQGLWGELAPQEARERMRAASMRAVELDDSLAEAHAVLGAYMHVYEWNSEAAEREQLRAIELDPSYPTARHYYSNLLRSMGRLEEALVQKAIAAQLDPLDPILTETLGTLLIRAGRFDEALEHVRDALELDSMFWWPHAGLGQYYEATGHLDEALGAYQRANQLRGQGRAYRLPAHIARVLARAGRKTEARQVLGELQAEALRTGLHDPGVAPVLLALDDLEGAFDWLELSYRERHPQLRFIAGSPEFAPFEVEPRYIDLLRRIGVRR
jgi:TolB-like protein/Flp pilus assembly protein TadD